MLSRLAFVAGLALWRPASATTFYDCQTSWGTGSVNCAHAAASVMMGRVGCDGKAFIPEKPATGYADICTATLSAPGHGNGVVVSDVALMRMFKPLIDRCGIGSFCDQDTGICGTLTTKAGPGKRDDNQSPVDEAALLALEVSKNKVSKLAPAETIAPLLVQRVLCTDAVILTGGQQLNRPRVPWPARRPPAGVRRAVQ